MTEHENLSGIVHHMDDCYEVGIVPIAGLEAYYRERRVTRAQVEAMRVNGEDVEAYFPYFHMVILALNVRGWRTLKLLSSEAYRSGGYRKHCIDDELLSKYNEGIMISTSCASGYVSRAILRGDDQGVKRHIDKLNRWVPDRWYFEVQPHDFDDQRVINLEKARLAQQYGRPLVATRDAHAPDESWIETQHVSVKMRTRESMIAQPRKTADVDEKYDLTVAPTAYIASAEQTIADFERYHPHLSGAAVREAVANTVWVADQVVPWLIDKTPKMPRFSSTVDADAEELRRRVYAGLREKGHDQDPRYVDGVEEELAIYRERGFSAFFLWADSMIKWLRSTDGLPPCEWDPHPAPTKKPEKVGLGRGSAGGCRVAYALGITLINPVTYDLSFPRFYNKDREGMPDIDIDLTSRGAELAKEWLKRKKGPDKVYDMIAHSTFGAREALRRVGMTYEVPHTELNALSKLIGDDETDLDLSVLREHVPELDRWVNSSPINAKVFEHASRLQKGNSKITEHASAVVISDLPLEEIVPVMKKSAKDDFLVTAFGNSADKETISNIGLLKFDLLVVVALARQAYAEELIGRVHDQVVNLDAMPWLEDPAAVDPKAMEIFLAGAKNGIFQWDGKSNMASLSKQILANLKTVGAPWTIHHLAAANAGVRPGISQHIPEYVVRAGGADFDYWDPAVEPALAETFGLPLFQEQIMRIFEILGGYTPNESDTVRRIMSKYYRIKGGKAAEMLAPHHERFVSNASSIVRGGKATAEQIWAYVGDVSDYLFNKSHAEEYACIAKGDAWLKAHYPDAFYASLLTFPPAWVKKPENRNSFYERNVREARHFGIDILPPDVNDSDESFTITGNAVRFGLSGIKGLGPAMVRDVINNRPFSSLEDMGARLTACNKAGRQALGAAGALDRFGARDNLTEDERAAHEEDRIGVALSGEDKLAPIREDLRPLLHTADEVDHAPNGQALVVGGEVVDGKEIKTSSRYGPSLKLSVAFGADEYKVSVAPKNWNENTPQGRALRELLASDVPIVVRGSKNVEYDNVEAEEIKAATEVLEIMSTPLAA